MPKKVYCIIFHGDYDFLDEKYVLIQVEDDAISPHLGLLRYIYIYKNIFFIYYWVVRRLISFFRNHFSR